MLPAIDPATGNLPPGMDEAPWNEVIARFGSTPRRLVLLAGLAVALRNLEAAGCQRAYLDGSLVSEKADPGDTDTCWDMEGVVGTLLDPVLLDFSQERCKQRRKYGG